MPWDRNAAPSRANIARRLRAAIEAAEGAMDLMERNPKMASRAYPGPLSNVNNALVYLRSAQDRAKL